MSEVKNEVEPIWMCCMADCNFSSPPTIRGFQQQAGHQLSHKGVPRDKRGFSLIDRGTGEVLALTLKEAEEKGLLELTKVVPPIPETPPPKVLVLEVPEVKKVEPPITATPQAIILEIPKEPTKVTPPKAEPPEETPEAKEEATKAKVVTVQSVGIFTYEITLPADAFVLFDLAKATGLEINNEKRFDEWVWDCIRKRYEKDYKKQLILAPIGED